MGQIKSISQVDLAVISMTIIPIFGIIYKTLQPASISYVLWAFYPGKFTVEFWPIMPKIMFYFFSLKQFEVLNDDYISPLFSIGMKITGVVMVVILFVLLLYSIIKTAKKTKYIFSMLLLSGAIISVSDLFIEPQYVRYLAFIFIGIFAMVSLAYDKNDNGQNKKFFTPQRVYLAFIGLLIVSIACANYFEIRGLDFKPNEAHTDLINYLK